MTDPLIEAIDASRAAMLDYERHGGSRRRRIWRDANRRLLRVLQQRDPTSVKRRRRRG